MLVDFLYYFFSNQSIWIHFLILSSYKTLTVVFIYTYNYLLQEI